MTDSEKFLAEPSLERGRAAIKHYVTQLSGTPGVYRMIGNAGEVLYVGKAKHLKNRVSNYLNAAALNTRLQSMISQTFTMDIVVTRSEAEALLLEANLIKKYTPKYNILLKDDKSFPFIFFSGDHDFARMEKHRGAKTRKGKYFGPFVSAGAVNEILVMLQKAFLLRTCSDSFFKNRSRPCILYQIKRCSGPCVGKIEPEDYKKLRDQAWDFLSGKSDEIRQGLVKEMQELSLQMHYEKARVVRDRIQAITRIQQHSGMAPNSVGDADVIALARQGGDCCVQIFSFRGGLNYGNKTFFPAHTADFSDDEVMRNFIGQIYQSQPAPPLILCGQLLGDAVVIEEALRLHSDYKIEIVHPLRGERRKLVEQAEANARQALQQHRSIHATQRQMLEKIQLLFGLEELPKRIEVYDNSHVSGTHAVGGMIVAGPAGFMKSEYRQFNIKDLPPNPAGGDDYAMLREVLRRRFSALRNKEDAKDVSPDKIPDLVLIDGGAGQLSVATQVFEELGVYDIPYAGIAKGPDRNAGREKFFLPGKEPFQLPINDPVLHALQRMRDEAHRFAIGTHRKKRSKALQKSQLDAIPFIGPHRKKALLLHFGSSREVSGASLEDLQKVEGISKTTAKMIYQHFHGETEN